MVLNYHTTQTCKDVLEDETGEGGVGGRVMGDEWG